MSWRWHDLLLLVLPALYLYLYFEEGFFVAARVIRSNPADGRLKRL